MSKKRDFLLIVQTMVISNSINLSTSSDIEKYRDVISATGAYVVMDEAIRASKMIPDRMSASQAAREFCCWMLRNLQDAEKAADSDFNLPAWFARN